jgi:hypothetical protein
MPGIKCIIPIFGTNDGHVDSTHSAMWLAQGVSSSTTEIRRIEDILISRFRYHVRHQLGRILHTVLPSKIIIVMSDTLRLPVSDENLCDSSNLSPTGIVEDDTAFVRRSHRNPKDAFLMRKDVQRLCDKIRR